MYSLLRRILFLLPTEFSHHLSLSSLSLLNSVGLLTLFAPKQTLKPVKVMGLSFPNKIGLAAGLDKNGDYISALSNIGFGFVEIGTVTPKPQAGNPSPRLFRLPKAEAIINRMGFNNKGIDYLTDQVAKVRRSGFDGIIGINIGKNIDTAVEDATQDYIKCLQVAYPYADYVTINISSPNTPGLRSLQYGKELNQLLAMIKEEQMKLVLEHKNYVPIAVKVAPDLNKDEIKDIAECLLENNMDALIATNTTLSRDAVIGLRHSEEQGGLSGTPVKELSTDVIREFAKHFNKQIPIIGVGGISSPQDAQEKLDAGAALIQIYTGLIFKGPNLVRSCVKTVN